MDQFRFAEVGLVILFFLIPVLLLFFIYAFYLKNKALQLFSSQAMFSVLMGRVSRTRQWFKSILLLIAIFFLVLTLMRPQGDPVVKKIEKKGRDLVFVIDVSRSMLAEDLKPNRLERAKQLVSDVIGILDGDRVGLLVFAGTTAIKVPLTLDYNYFKNALRKISPRDINRGGTHIGDAIRSVTDRIFYDQDNKYRDIIFITDGEDQDSFPIEAAEAAKEKGVRIHTVGLGSPDGSNIPLRDKDKSSYQLLKYENQTVTTKLDEETLKKIAEITEGVFIPVRTNLADLAELYTKYIAVEEKRDIEAEEATVWRELFQFFLGLAIFFLMLEMLISEYSGRRREEEKV